MPAHLLLPATAEWHGMQDANLSGTHLNVLFCSAACVAGSA
jgi:hypothetical protein